MPLPMPHDGESHDDFHSRCMADPVMQEEHPEQDQRNAICQKQWDKKKKMGLYTGPIPDKSDWLRTESKGAIGVDRKHAVIRGVILAEEGPFKSEGRGEFDRRAIRTIVKLGNEKAGGLKSRFTHPSLSDDGLGKYLGRQKNLRSDTILRESGQDADGKAIFKEVLVARGDLHLDKTALEEPPSGGKPLGVYVMDLAESDPDAFGTSLVLQKNEEFRLDKQGKRLKDEAGEDLPPLWIPTKLHASDVVDEGDATNSMLAADILAGLPDALVRQGCEMLDMQFPNEARETIKTRLSAFVDRYLNHRFGEPEESEPPKQEPVSQPSDDALLLELELALEE